MHIFENSDNLEFLNTHHAGLGDEICFFSSQKTHIMFVIVSINYSWVSQLDHRIVMSSVFDGRWKFDQIMSNQNKVFWGVGKSQGSRFRLPRFTSGLKKVFVGWLDFIVLFLVWLHSLPPCCPATTRLFSITWRASTCATVPVCNCLLSFSILF